MPSVSEYITARAPGYLTYTALSELIAQATLETGDVYCGSDLRNKAIMLLTCHWIALDKRDGAGIGIAGNLSSEREGDLARSYGMQGVSKASDRDLGQTRWGLELLRLRRSCILSARTRQM